jgi:hypothetical protein
VGFEMTMLFNGAIDSTAQGDLPMRAVSAIRASTERAACASRAEAEFLFLMDRSGQIGERGFQQSAVRAIRDLVVVQGEPRGMVAEADVDWLLGMVGDKPTAFGSAVVFAVVRACDQAPSRLSELAIRAAVGRCLMV